jgi:hypothetical protein
MLIGDAVLKPFTRVMTLALMAIVVTACVTDQTVQLRYMPGSGIERLPSAQAVSIFRFADRRGDEGDGNPRRVGGIYGSYGNRVAMVFAATPWPEKLVEDLAAGFTQRGVEAVGVTDREFVPRETVVSTPFALGGEIRNFSTEMRWTLQSHVSGIIRLYDKEGTLLLEKTISARIPRDDSGYQWDKQASVYENFLNAAVHQFVRAVVTDPDLTQRLAAAR